ncbi:MAG: hypothetical protein JWM55_308 [Acidimicrobiaceae bacterium]|nr:hypothetical protein [Acidimicrobiaceae bacterium]
MIEEAQINDGEGHAHDHPEGAERRGDEEGDHKPHYSHHERRKGGSAQEAWEGIGGKVF